ncbi:Gfo/Idh/MocA family protein [Stratiformator vulcanicus]|uniref:Inositol 2-dehydrogenase n=1 Tax=Stratiformator vulcanicus TaxID=2527980 RepID=A0A517QYP9_9PLAN|nr:Gfo/Idh/MocA family oxidoreductase [Stratiformator vulcanicus]QDT36779.1 Inositol 2-dehydrogenase [Stratiformator vulcanicus]
MESELNAKNDESIPEPTDAGHIDGSDLIRVGLVGCGGRGSGAALQALNTEGPVQLVAMADLFEDRLNSAVKHLGARMATRPERFDVPPERQFSGFDGIDRVLECDVDVVLLTTPPGFRPEHFEKAVAAKKHIFMEKPVATDIFGIKRVMTAAQKAKKHQLRIGVGFQQRHHPSYIEAAKRLRDGVIGRPLFWKAYYNSFGVWEPRRTRQQCRNELEYQQRNWYYYTWLSGDHLVEQHIHQIDAVCWFQGAYPERARGMGGRQVRTAPRYGQIYDHFNIDYEFADGTHYISQCRHNPSTWTKVGTACQGTNGSFETVRYRECRFFTNGKKSRVKSVANAYQLEHDALFAAIRDNRLHHEIEYGAQSTLTAILGRMAAYTGRELSIRDVLASEEQLVPNTVDWSTDPPIAPDEQGRYPVPMPGIYHI